MNILTKTLLAIVAALLAGQAGAQCSINELIPGPPCPPFDTREIIRFNTYEDAINILLSPKSTLSPNPVETGNFNCGLLFGNTSIDLMTLGSDLYEHCDEIGNEGAGSVLGGSLLSFQPTRSVSQFDLRPRRAEASREKDKMEPEEAADRDEKAVSIDKPGERGIAVDMATWIEEVGLSPSDVQWLLASNFMPSHRPGGELYGLEPGDGDEAAGLGIAIANALLIGKLGAPSSDPEVAIAAGSAPPNTRQALFAVVEPANVKESRRGSGAWTATAAPLPSQASNGGASSPSGMDLALMTPRTQLFGRFSHETIDVGATEFASAVEITRRETQVGAGFLVTPRLFLGASFGWSENAGAVRGPETVSIYFEEADYEASCGLPSGGRSDATNRGFTVFVGRRTGDRGLLSFSAGLSRGERDYERSLCMTHPFMRDEDISVVAGRLSGQPDIASVDVALRYSHTFDLGRLHLIPSLELATAEDRIEAYTETETAGNAPVLSPEILEDPDNVGEVFTLVSKLTGAALAYDEQTVSSLKSRVGLALEFPSLRERVAVIWRLEAAWYHEFSNDQRDIVARFVQDLRDEPQRFSYLSNAPVRNYYSLDAGVSAQFRRGELSFRARSVLNNKLNESLAAEIGFSRWF